MPEQTRMIELIAALHREAPIAVLTQSGGVDDFDHHVNWQQIIEYLRMIDAENVHVHIPFL